MDGIESLHMLGHMQIPVELCSIVRSVSRLGRCRNIRREVRGSSQLGRQEGLDPCIRYSLNRQPQDLPVCFQAWDRLFGFVELGVSELLVVQPLSHKACRLHHWHPLP